MCLNLCQLSKKKALESSRRRDREHVLMQEDPFGVHQLGLTAPFKAPIANHRETSSIELQNAPISLSISL